MMQPHREATRARPWGRSVDSKAARPREKKTQMSKPARAFVSYYPVLFHIRREWPAGCKCRVCRAVDDGVMHVRKDLLKDQRQVAAEGRRRPEADPGRSEPALRDHRDAQSPQTLR
jgi:hypothetical protein